MTRLTVAGHVSVYPPLNAAEFEYLMAFKKVRHHADHLDPYEVPGCPWQESSEGHGGSYNEPGSGQPGLWCDWEPSCGGKCLIIDARDKVWAPVPWLQYLVDHFLMPGSFARRSKHPDFAEFTFDHEIRGAVAMFAGESGGLSLVRVVRGEVQVEDVWDGDNPVRWDVLSNSGL